MKSTAGSWITGGLFKETASIGRESSVVMTLQGEDTNDYKSFPKLYLALTESDPTEYTMALAVFGSWEHWVAVSKAVSLKPVIAKLREEMSVRQKSKAMQYMITEVAEKGKSSFQAAKLLLDKPWVEKQTTAAARKQAKAQATKEDQQVLRDFKEDAKRLGITVN